MSKTKFKYELTGRYGTRLYEALRERDFDKYTASEIECELEASKIGGYSRDNFILWLKEELSYVKWADYARRAEVSSDKLSEWLVDNELPNDEGEQELRKKYAQEYGADAANYYMDVIDSGNDVEVAYNFRLIKFTDLPQDAQRKIKFLCDRANKYGEMQSPCSEVSNKLRNCASRIENEAAEILILVTGFYCNIHGDNTEFKEPIPLSEVLRCPACNHPVCPICANAYEKDPCTIDEGREYVASCESNSGRAWCGNCGDYSVEFMLRFLKLVDCPIPPKCEDFKPIQREATFYMTQTIAALPNKDDILRTAITEFNKGTSGIIKIQDPSGIIWAIPERHEDGWKVGVMRPEER